MLFASDNTKIALRYFPDGRGYLDMEMRRYEMLRFGSAIGFQATLLLQQAASGPAV